MNAELDTLLRRIEPPSPANHALRLRFGLACVERVEHLLEEPDVIAGLRAFEAAVRTGADAPALASLAARARELANRHRGSRSLDGVGHAAVSSTYAYANALAGNARQAAEYAAYAAVYGQGGYGATLDAESFAPEFAWQAQRLRALLGEPAAAAGAARAV